MKVCSKILDGYRLYEKRQITVSFLYDFVCGLQSTAKELAYFLKHCNTYFTKLFILFTPFSNVDFYVWYYMIFFSNFEVMLNKKTKPSML